VPVLRENPYGRFNYTVSLGDGDPESVVAGFSEVSGLGLEVGYAEYRNGNEKANTPRRIPGVTRFPDVMLKRGVIGSDDLFAWIKGVSAGQTDPRTVVVTLLDEQREPVAAWRLRQAQPRKWSGPDLQATSSDVAIEELVLVHEGIDFQ
jgi:phage tail-like protein